MDLYSISAALDRFAADHQGVYPKSLKELLVEDERDRSYLPGDYEEMPTDPWKHPYVYTPSEDRRDYQVMSYGSDGLPGGKGDAEDVQGPATNRMPSPAPGATGR